MSFLVELFSWVWTASLSATVLVGFAVLVLVCLSRVLPAWARYAVWLLVFLRLIVPVVPIANFSMWNLRVSQSSSSQPYGTITSPATYQPAIQQTASPRRERSAVPLLPVIWMVGVLGWLAIAIGKHQRLTTWVCRQQVCTDARILSLLDRARTAFGLRAHITVICNERFEVPAVFGVFRPKLLLPALWPEQAGDDELHAILLHEVAHVKCRDTLVNWLCILVRSIHWFNPAVWYAFKRLRREREVFCDALVLARLRPAQRSVYGGALIKMAARLSGAAAPTSLVPVLQHKPEIHRRIHMIAKYKSTPWVISAGIGLLLIAIAGLTFTRAAEKQSPAPAPAAAAPAQDPSKPLHLLQREIDQQHARVRDLQAQADEIHAKLNQQSMDVIVSPGPSEVVRKMEMQRIEAQANYERLSSLYKYLSQLSRADLKSSIGTAAPDQQLSDLMQAHNMAEQKLADVLEDRAAEHPDVKRATRILNQIEKQIEARMDGIMSGLKARLAAEQAQLAATEKSLAMARQHHFENVQQSRPYQQLLQELRAQEEILQRLRMRMAEERIGRALEESTRN